MIVSLSFLRAALPNAQLHNPDFEAWFAHHATTDIIPVTDSRDVKPNTLFVAISGAQVDGHDFVEQAIEAGACIVLIEKNKVGCYQNLSAAAQKNVLCIAADDTVAALVSLAKVWRKRFTIPVVGVTGSMGKTTTKEMLRTIFEHAGICAFVSHGNQNSIIGAPLNILQLNEKHTLAVFEMGINATGEMAELVDLVRPTTAVITTIAHAHGEGIGSLADIAREKSVIFSQLPPDAVCLITGDQPQLKKLMQDKKTFTFGFKRGNMLRADQVQAHFSVEQMQMTCRVTCGATSMQLVLNNGHRGTLHNALAALAVAHMLGIDLAAAVDALAQFKAVSQRFEGTMISGNRGFIINDAHNANPETMKHAIESFDQIVASVPKIAVIGQMAELGTRAKHWHAQIGSLLAQSHSLSKVILVGERMKNQQQIVSNVVPCVYVDTWEHAYDIILKELDSKPLILLKSSKSVGLRYIPDRLNAIGSF